MCHLQIMPMTRNLLYDALALKFNLIYIALNLVIQYTKQNSAEYKYIELWSLTKKTSINEDTPTRGIVKHNAYILVWLGLLFKKQTFRIKYVRRKGSSEMF